MGTAGAFTPEKLVLGVLTSRPEIRREIAAAAGETWGPVDYESSLLPFTWSHYYDEEMGTPIQRFFLSLETLVDPSCLAVVKQTANLLEERWHVGRRRTVNLDPGLVALSRFILATTKENAHRIPLSGGIYAEVTLLWVKGSYRGLEWTYPDYRSEPVIAILNHIRSVYKDQLKKPGAG
jgi:hypothetical protein